MSASDTNDNKQPLPIDTPIAENLDQLLSFNDEAFIYCAYRTILQRDPDKTGMSHYLSKLHHGENKLKILSDLSASEEGRDIDADIPGLKAGIRRHKVGALFGLKHLLSSKHETNNTTSDENEGQEVVVTQSEPSLSDTNVINFIVIPKSEYDSTKSQQTNKNIQNKSKKNIWIDLTESLQFIASMQPIKNSAKNIRIQLELAYSVSKSEENIQFCMQVENGFAAIEQEQLNWLVKAIDIYDAYSKLHANINLSNSKDSIHIKIPDTKELFYPFKSNDIVLSVFCKNEIKEALLSKIKALNASICIGTIIYESAPINKETSLYILPHTKEEYLKHLKWVSNCCDFQIFSSDYIRSDVISTQKKMGWSSPPESTINLGQSFKTKKSLDEKLTLDKFKLQGSYIFVLGVVALNGNYDTIYKAFRMLLRDGVQTSVKLVVCLDPDITFPAKDLIDSLERDPIIKNNVTLISPTDDEIFVLQKHSTFVILPGVLQSANNELVSSLSLGKLPIVAKSHEHKAIAKNFIEYIEPLDVKEWASKIRLYLTNSTELSNAEGNIKKNWAAISWQDCTKTILDNLNILSGKMTSNKSAPEIWFDLSTSYLYWEGGVAGIIRTELTFAKYIYDISPNVHNIHFFAMSQGKFFEITPDKLQWLLNSDDITRDYKWFQDFWKNHEFSKDPFVDGPPLENDPRVLHSFPDNSVILFTCIDWNMSQSRIKLAVDMRDVGRNIVLSQLLYDMTPFLVPHLHAPATCEGYIPFVKYVSNNFDHLIYGGQTAMRDTIKIQRERGWLSPASDYIEFGSDLQQADKEINEDEDKNVLKKFGISNKFILTVGTIEPRKNHEMLYKAYLSMMAKDANIDLPTLVIVGKRGWKYDDFLNVFEQDTIVKNKIIIISPNDNELDVLYRKCLFTVLPSFYEGWSLTLPESLGYGKFCLTSKVDPLIETGRDLVEYIDPLDIAEWGNRIYFYSQNLPLLKEKEKAIALNWKPKTWKEATQSLWDLANARYTKIMQDSETNIP